MHNGKSKVSSFYTIIYKAKYNKSVFLFFIKDKV